MDPRLAQLTAWTRQQLTALGIAVPAAFALAPVSGDASFRRYFRARIDGHSFIAMDAPPDREDSAPFVAIARAWQPHGIHVPALHATDLTKGFLLIEDLGDRLYLGEIDTQNADRLYAEAFDTLLRIQRSPEPADYALPPYSEALLRQEMNLFRDWLCGSLLNLALPAAWFDPLCTLLVQNAQEQPQVPVHRDYHARNLLVTGNGAPGVIDFQDAVTGPVTYDLVSLLRDCYLQWPEARVHDWALDYAALARQAGLLETDDDRFLRWFHRMGIQRHLKAAGIFARLWLRDGKPGYLADIPRTLSHILVAAIADPAIDALSTWIRGPMQAAMLEHQALADATREYLA